MIPAKICPKTLGTPDDEFWLQHGMPEFFIQPAYPVFHECGDQFEPFDSRVQRLVFEQRDEDGIGDVNLLSHRYKLVTPFFIVHQVDTCVKRELLLFTAE